MNLICFKYRNGTGEVSRRCCFFPAENVIFNEDGRFSLQAEIDGELPSIITISGNLIGSNLTFLLPLVHILIHSSRRYVKKVMMFTELHLSTFKKLKLLKYGET